MFSTIPTLWFLAPAGALVALAAAYFFSRTVMTRSEGDAGMIEIASAVRSGAMAYLKRQYKVVSLVFLVLVVVLLVLGMIGAQPIWSALGVPIAGLFSGLCGWFGMKMATNASARTTFAAKNSLNDGLTVAFRAGAVMGLVVVGFALLDVSVWFLLWNTVLKGFLPEIEPGMELVPLTTIMLSYGMGASTQALFARVGGGIYTKAADVGADLVGKVEAGIPEDDARNPATIADNVGDNVGDCAGMAADIFESYEVTIVAAMILGLASFGHKGVIFPLLVRGIGVLGSIISTYTVKAGPNDTSDTALHSVHRGFWIGSMISVAGFFLIGLVYLHFDANYLSRYQMAVAGFPGGSPAGLAWWNNLGMSTLDLRPAWTCLVGVFLAISLNKVTSYYTHTSHAPVKGLARACQTGHATNIIQGFAVGYESTVAAILVIAGSIILSVLIYAGTPPVFVAFGVAMTGIGMLTLTGNTISMDVFGPVADNANGIGEMGYDREAMGEEKYKRARQILADLDAVGNTTKAETKGIAIGSAVIAAVSLFASFIAVIAVGSEDRLLEMTPAQYREFAGKLTVADPMVLIGFLIGGAVPFLFSSMLIRAVGRAAFFIVKECRVQFKDPAIMAGTRKPDYGRVVAICTTTAQKELIGPALLAILAPAFVGFLLGPYALGGFLAGMILVGQLLAVFMANAGGAWDNAKKTIEDGMYGGKGSEAHKASVTGDTVGDPLKDTAGPAINPLVKVMNMVSLLGLGLVLSYNVVGINPSGAPTAWPIGLLVAFVSLLLILWAVWRSKHETAEMREIVGSLEERA